MRKSSVYLPDELKADLAALAARWDRPEAELIRLAIERLVTSSAAEPAPGRTPAITTGPRLIGVGVGPGDPDLVTERALAVLRTADLVFAPSTSLDAISRAEAVVRAAAPEVRVDRLVIEIGNDASARSRSIEQGVQDLIDHLDKGAVVAVAVLGDPNVYSVHARLTARVRAERPSIPIDAVPGVMSFQALAAHTGTTLVDGNEQLTVLALGDDATPIEPLLADDDRTIVVYKGGRHVPELARLLDAHDRCDGAVLGELLGLPGGRSVPVDAVADRPASYLATVVVPARRPTLPIPDEEGIP